VTVQVAVLLKPPTDDPEAVELTTGTLVTLIDDPVDDVTDDDVVSGSDGVLPDVQFTAPEKAISSS